MDGPVGSLPSVMGGRFSKVPQVNIQRSSFDRSHGLKTTLDAGYLVPILVDEALPGDTINCNMTSFVRMQTLKSPYMDNVFCDTFFFSVPMRLLWTNWEKFCGRQDNPGDSIVFTIPQMVSTAITGYATGSLHDYLGIPIKIAGLTHSSLWHRAYNLIYNEWFRDQNLQDSVVVDTDNGPDDPDDYVLLRRGKRHDYFTSCLTDTQKGNAVELPIGGVIDVVMNPTLAIQPHFRKISDHTLHGATTVNSDASGHIVSGTGGINSLYDPSDASDTTLIADMGTGTAVTINDMREAFQTQIMLERDMRSGTRYKEVLQAHFGVTTPDYRLQRPEYLGGGSSPIMVHPVAQTSETNTTKQANLAGFATSSGQHGFSKSFTEHCLILGLTNIRADLNYQQGLPRQFSRLTRYDFYWPAFAHLGEQAVLNKEIWADASSNDEDPFGYQERYAEYRYKPSWITGKFRSDATGTLDQWHVATDFAALPVLNASFIEDDPPISRVVAVTTEPQFYWDGYFKYIHVRPMPVYGVPGLIDHF